MAPWDEKGIGGASSHLSSLEKAIALTGNQSDLVSEEELPLRIRDACWQLAHILPGREFAISTFLVEMLHGLLGLQVAFRGDVGLVNAHHVSCLPAARWISRFVGAPVVLTVHSYYAQDHLSVGYMRRDSREEHFARALERFAYENADFVFAVDTRIRDYVLAESKQESDRVIVRLNFVDTVDFQPRDRSVAREALDQAGLKLGNVGTDGRQLILCPRRLSPKNGVDYFIRAAQIVDARKGARVHFLIAGDGPQLPELLELRKALGLEDHVMFLGGVRPDLIRYLYNLVDAVVVPSITIEGIQEASSIAALEAMASGVPLICSAIGGLKEIVADGETGYLVPEKDPETLAASILKILGEDQTAITTRAVQYVRERRSLESYAKDLAAFLRDHVPRSGPHPVQAGTAMSSRANR